MEKSCSNCKHWEKGVCGLHSSGNGSIKVWTQDGHGPDEVETPAGFYCSDHEDEA